MDEKKEMPVLTKLGDFNGKPISRITKPYKPYFQKCEQCGEQFDLYRHALYIYDGNVFCSDCLDTIHDIDYTHPIMTKMIIEVDLAKDGFVLGLAILLKHNPLIPIESEDEEVWVGEGDYDSLLNMMSEEEKLIMRETGWAENSNAWYYDREQDGY